ncbi:hypothetical protein, partial [Burkholderia anthina]|uniref:hypothetical protein n=1 Tax=Burkholderia anthina TaxID=179879 RepID=UPI001ABA14E8
RSVTCLTASILNSSVYRLPLMLTSSVAINYGSKMSTKGWPVHGDQPAAHHQRLPATGFSVSDGFQQAGLTVALNVVTEQQEFTRSSRALGADAEGRSALVNAEGETAGADGELEHV